jgi:hypothetical protein
MQSPQELTLDRYLRKRSPLDPPQAVKIAIDIASQLSPSGDSMLVHPGRILVHRDGTVRLLPPAAEELALPAIVEFPAYASPEEIRGAKPDLRSGLYSLGCTLFELLAGHPPFTSADPREVLHAHLEKPVPDLKQAAPAVSDRLAGAVMDLLAKDPELRIQTPGELVRRLKQSLASTPGGSSHAAAPPAVRPASPRSPALPPSPTLTPSPRPSLSTARPTPPGRATDPLPEKSIPVQRSRPATPRKASPGAPQPARGPAKPAPAASSRAGRSIPGRRNGAGASSARRGADARGMASRTPLRKTRGRGIPDLDADLDADLAEDAEDLGPEPPRRRRFLFTIGGGVIGILVSLLVVRARDTDVRERKIEIENRLADESKKEHVRRKQFFTAEYEKKRRDVQLALASIAKMPAEEKQDAYFSGMKAHWMSPGGFQFGEELAKVWVPPTAKASQETPEAARAYEAQLQEAKKLHSEGKIARARDKLITDVHLHKKHEEEIRQYQKQWEDEYVAKWEADKVQVDRLAREGKPDEAVEILRAAEVYGDEQIRKEADKMVTSIQSQVVLQGGAKGSDEKDEEGSLDEEPEKDAGETDEKATDNEPEGKPDEPPVDEGAGEPEGGGTEESSGGDGA